MYSDGARSIITNLIVSLYATFEIKILLQIFVLVVRLQGLPKVPSSHLGQVHVDFAVRS